MSDNDTKNPSEIASAFSVTTADSGYVLTVQRGDGSKAQANLPNKRALLGAIRRLVLDRMPVNHHVASKNALDSIFGD